MSRYRRLRPAALFVLAAFLPILASSGPALAAAAPATTDAVPTLDPIGCVGLFRWLGDNEKEEDDRNVAHRAEARAATLARPQIADADYENRANAAEDAVDAQLKSIKQKQGDKSVGREIDRQRTACATLITEAETSKDWGADAAGEKTWDVVMALESQRFMPEAALNMCSDYDAAGKKARGKFYDQWLDANSWKVSMIDSYANFLGPKLFPNAPIGATSIVQVLHDKSVAGLTERLKTLPDDAKSHYCGKFEFMPLFTAALDEPVFRGTLDVLDQWIASKGLINAPPLSAGVADADDYKTEYQKPIDEVLQWQERTRLLSTACDKVDPSGKDKRAAAYDRWKQATAAPMQRFESLARDVAARAAPKKSAAMSYDSLRKKAVERAAADVKNDSSDEKKKACENFAVNLEDQAPMTKVIRDASLYLERWQKNNGAAK